MKCKLNQLKVGVLTSTAVETNLFMAFFLLCEAHTEVWSIMVPAALTGTRQEVQEKKTVYI